MSGAESQSGSASGHVVTVEDVRELMGASTPHFALQSARPNREAHRPLDADDPARVLARPRCGRLERLALSGETRGGEAQDGERALASLATD